MTGCAPRQRVESKEAEVSFGESASVQSDSWGLALPGTFPAGAPKICYLDVLRTAKTPPGVDPGGVFDNALKC